MSHDIEAIGRALYGDHWQGQLARALGVAERTMRRWFSGAMPIPSGAFDDMRRLCRDRANALDSIADTLEAPPPSGGAPSIRV